MVRARFTPVTPDQRIRELRKEFAALRKEDPSDDLVPRLASFTRTAHLERQLNMAMHTGARCLELDPSAPDALVSAYLNEQTVSDGEQHLRALIDLQDLARYLDRSDVRDLAETQIHDVALAWLRAADEHEVRHHVRTLTSMFDRATADSLHDEARR